MAIAPVVILTTIALVPLLFTLYESFSIWNRLQEVGWGTLTGYRELLTPEILRATKLLAIRATIVATTDLFLAILWRSS
jgi:ABC-type sugar transport system permease subunit